jgi:alpha-galactosidase
MKKLIPLLVALVSFAGNPAHAQKFSELAQTPPMGWNSWNKFQWNVDEPIIRAMADAMETNGMKAAGYQYINIDDCWQGTRDAQGFIQPDATKFPSGIKALADYVHSKGLKLGIYSDVGYKTCGGRVASRGHEFQDAQTYAQWGVDYLKYDWCNAEGLNAEGAYTTMRDAIYAAGRPMIFSLCEWGKNMPWTWAQDVGHLWRTTADIYPGFDGILDHTNWQQWSVLKIVDAQKPLRTAAGPGHWNDPDMLEVGNGMSASEDRAHFSMWCMLAAPLISGNDLAHMNPEVLATLTNPEVIAVDQDPLGVEAFVYSTNNNVEIWFKPLANGDWAMCALNRGTAAQNISFDWKNENVSDAFSKRDANLSTTTYALKNLWTGETTDTTKSLSAEVPGHDVLMLRLRNPAAVAATAGAQKIIRIKMGVTAPFKDEEGNIWEADHGFVDGDTVERDADMPIANTKTPSLYRSERYGMTAFSLPLTNGKYTVKLHFAETYTDLDTAGSRIFSFSVAGHEFKDLDIFAKTGGVGRAYVEPVPVEITDGKLNITFTANVENPEINAIEIIPAT